MSDLNNPQRWKCGNCGHSFYDDDGWSEWYCSQCGEKMHQSTPEGYVPEDELRALVEEWLESEVDKVMNHAELAEKQAFESCINQLEGLIDDE